MELENPNLPSDNNQLGVTLPSFGDNLSPNGSQNQLGVPLPSFGDNLSPYGSQNQLPDTSLGDIPSHHIEPDKMALAKNKYDEPNIGKQKFRIRYPEDIRTHIWDLDEIPEIKRVAVNSLQDMKMDECLELVGAESRYQIILTIQACLLSIVMSMILYSQSFLITNPEFFCRGIGENKLEYCLEEDFCSMHYKDGK